MNVVSIVLLLCVSILAHVKASADCNPDECPTPNCQHAITPEGECCPVCPFKCLTSDEGEECNPGYSCSSHGECGNDRACCLNSCGGLECADVVPLVLAPVGWVTEFTHYSSVQSD